MKINTKQHNEKNYLKLCINISNSINFNWGGEKMKRIEFYKRLLDKDGNYKKYYFILLKHNFYLCSSNSKIKTGEEEIQEVFGKRC